MGNDANTFLGPHQEVMGPWKWPHWPTSFFWAGIFFTPDLFIPQRIRMGFDQQKGIDCW
jgi:hypothetical protein